MTGLPFAVGRYGRDTHTPEGIAATVRVAQATSELEIPNLGNQAEEVFATVATTVVSPHGAAGAVLPGTGEKGVPPRHALLSPPDPASANMGEAHVSPAPRNGGVDAPRHGASEVVATVAKAPGPATADMLTQGEIARAQGFTGDCCIGCGGFSMRRNGTCLLCVDCGATTGCS